MSRVTFVILLTVLLQVPVSQAVTPDACIRNLLENFSSTPELAIVLKSWPDLSEHIQASAIESVIALGSGSSAKVYLIRPKAGQGEPFVVKRFFQTRKNQYHFGIHAEFAKYELMEEILKNAPEESIKSVKATRVGEKDFRLEWAKGDTLQQILSNPNVSRATKEELIRRYQRGFDHILRELEQRYPDAEIATQMDTYSGLEVSNMRVIDEVRNFGVAIRPNQVVVDPSTLEIRLIDPW